MKGSKLTPSPLHLIDPRPDRVWRYRALELGDDLYQHAAGLFHLQDTLPELGRRVLLDGIAKVWPLKGRRAGQGHSEYRADVVLFFSQLGFPVEVIAEKWRHPAKEVQRWLTSAERRLEQRQEVRIEADDPNAVPTFDALARASVESEDAKRHAAAKRDVVLDPVQRLMEKPRWWFENDSPAEEVRLLIRRPPDAA